MEFVIREAEMKRIPRSMLFTPATKTGHFTAAAAVGADAVILDLEDSVAPAAKDEARRDALNYLAAGRFSDTSEALRINSPATLAGWHDLNALLDSAADPDFIVIPKLSPPPSPLWSNPCWARRGKPPGSS